MKILGLVVVLLLISIGYYFTSFVQGFVKGGDGASILVLGPSYLLVFTCFTVAFTTKSARPLVVGLLSMAAIIVVGLFVTAVGSSAGPGYMFPLFHILAIPAILVITIVAIFFLWPPLASEPDTTNPSEPQR